MTHAERQRLLDLVIVGVLPRMLPQCAKPYCTVEQALRMTADEWLPWEIDGDRLNWPTEGDYDDDK